MTAKLRIRESRHPVLYELDTRSWLERLSRRHGRRIQLGSVPSEDLAPILATGADLVWLMGVWRTGAAGRQIARGLSWVNDEARAILPDFSPADVVGSPYAVSEYEVASSLGGESGLATLRRQLAESGVGLVLDFVPNHTATDHLWVWRNPDWYVQGTSEHVATDPVSWFTVRAATRFTSPMGATRTFPPGRTRRSWTTAFPPCARPWPTRCGRSRLAATGFVATRPCSSSTTCSVRPGRDDPPNMAMATAQVGSSGGTPSEASASDIRTSP